MGRAFLPASGLREWAMIALVDYGMGNLGSVDKALHYVDAAPVVTADPAEVEHAEAIVGDRAIPDFAPGDTVRVNVKVTEGTRSRIQAYEGVCIARSGGGLNEGFTVRKISYGEGVERVFPVLSPSIESVQVVKRGKVRRAKLYYLRGRRGKSARIAEKQDYRTRTAEITASLEAEPARGAVSDAPEAAGDT